MTLIINLNVGEVSPRQRVFRQKAARPHFLGKPKFNLRHNRGVTIRAEPVKVFAEIKKILKETKISNSASF